MILTDAQIKDLVTGTLKHLGRLKFQQIAQSLPRYEVMGRLMRRDRVTFQSGNGIQRTVMVTHSGAAKHVGLYQKDEVNVGDVLETLSIPWRHTTTNYAFERRELTMNSGASKIVDLLKVRRTDAMLSLTELMESTFWSKPENSADKITPYGIQYWLVSNASEGFNGGDPSGFADGAGGLQHANWKNWTAQYADVSKADLIQKMRKAYRHIRFESPVDVPDFRRGCGDQYRIYVPETVLEEFENIGEGQNENLGRDLQPYDENITFRRNPIRWVPELDNAADAPVYMVNFAYFYPVFLRGEYLRETEPEKVSDQHSVFAVHVDLTWNVLCTDRRRNAVLATA